MKIAIVFEVFVIRTYCDIWPTTMNSIQKREATWWPTDVFSFNKLCRPVKRARASRKGGSARFISFYLCWSSGIENPVVADQRYM